MKINTSARQTRLETIEYTERVALRTNATLRRFIRDGEEERQAWIQLSEENADRFPSVNTFSGRMTRDELLKLRNLIDEFLATK